MFRGHLALKVIVAIVAVADRERIRCRYEIEAQDHAVLARCIEFKGRLDALQLRNSRHSVV
jgi:hypothetical protein